MEIKIKSLKKLKDNTYKVELEDGNEITLLDEVILKYNLLINNFIDSKELNKLLNANNEAICYNKALKYLGIRIRHQNEVIKYLERQGFSKATILNCIKRLEEQNYLNEELFVKAFVNDEINLNNSGPAKIKYKLLKIGVKDDLINKYISNINEDVWLNMLDNIIDKKIVLYKRASINRIKEKILVSCMNEGFKKEDVLNILENKAICSDLKSLEKEAIKLKKKISSKFDENEVKYQLRRQLLSKGYLFNEIEEIIDKL